MENLELYKILTIEGEDGKEKDYTIANKLEYNESTYLYLIGVDEEENLIENSQLMVKLVVSEGEEFVEKITDEEEQKEVAKLFFELFKEMATENN